jgi:transposase
MTATIQRVESTETVPTMCVAIELSLKQWRLAIAMGLGQAPIECTMPAGDAAAFQRHLLRAKERFGVTTTTKVASCYEAGRDGFWVARWLETAGVENVVVDSASIEVPRRKRRAKTDRVDARGLLRLLIRYRAGDRHVWRVVTVPSVETEDRRHLHRALEAWKADRTRVRNRIRGLLMTHGIGTGRSVPRDLTRLRTWDGHPLPASLRQRVEHEMEHVAFITKQIRGLEATQRAAVAATNDAVIRQVQQLKQLRGIALTSAWVFVMEGFGWRQFRNARQIGALSGLAPTPYQSGNSRLEQGIAKAGNRRWRTMAVEIAWNWLRFQRGSALTQWYLRRFAEGGPRAKRIGLIALARKLLVALWRYLQTGTVPAGATVRAAG